MRALPPSIDVLVPCETIERLSDFTTMLLEANADQNLISRATTESVWDRHIVDSLQLLPLAQDGSWLDIGSGAGLPGLVIAIARRWPMTLVEPRSRRAVFLRSVAERLGLDHVAVVQSRAETAEPVAADVISARAVAGLAALFAAGTRHAAPGCVWLLPKGRSAAEELAAARRTWQGEFRLIPSLTDPEAHIVMARDVRPIRRRGPA